MGKGVEKSKGKSLHSVSVHVNFVYFCIIRSRWNNTSGVRALIELEKEDKLAQKIRLSWNGDFQAELSEYPIIL